MHSMQLSQDSMMTMFYRATFAAAGLLYSSAAFADVGSPKSAGVTKGKASIEYKGARVGDSAKHKNNDQKHEFELYYGLTDRIKLGFERSYENEPQDGMEGESYIPNITFETTRQGDWWLSSAVFAEYKMEEGDPNSAKIVLIAEREEGPITIRANLGMGREHGGGRESGVSAETALQGLYKISPRWNPGIEWHADYGKWSTLGDDSGHKHYVGPVLAGTLFTVGNSAIGYAAGYYWGLTDASSDNAQRVMLKYETQF